MENKGWMLPEKSWKAVAIPYRCRDCPYPGHGFICHSRDGSCMRTAVEEINQRSRRMRILSRHREVEKKK